jgi:hypothetical protein
MEARQRRRVESVRHDRAVLPDGAVKSNGLADVAGPRRDKPEHHRSDIGRQIADRLPRRARCSASRRPLAKYTEVFPVLTAAFAHTDEVRQRATAKPGVARRCAAKSPVSAESAPTATASGRRRRAPAAP